MPGYTIMTTEREQKILELVRRYRERLEREWPEGKRNVEQIEEIVGRVERETHHELTETWIQEQTGKREGNRAACPTCRAAAAYSRQVETELVTAYGRVRAARAYFYCRSCRQGFCPQDRAWGIGPGETTPTVQSLTGYLGVKDSYVGVPATLARVRPQVHLGTKTIELIAQELGGRVPAARPQITERASRPLAALVDGTMLPVRGGNKEVRCGVVYEPDWEAGRQPNECRALRKEYFATLESKEAVMRQVCAAIERRRPSLATRVAALADGDPNWWRLYAACLPNREEILDFYHVTEHLGALARVRFADPAAGQKWREERKQSLLLSGPELLLADLEKWEPRTAAAREFRERELGYFRTNRSRMDYPRYLREGWPIGSGAVEGACRHLVGDRFKGTGMRWKVATAEPLLQLRAAVLTAPDLDLRRYAYAT